MYAVGFLPKVKKILESICVLCGKLKNSPHLDPRLAEAVRFIRDPKKRLAVVHSLVKTKNTCEMDAVPDEGDAVPDEGPTKGHGGCGHVQPQIRREGLKLFMVYAKGKDEVSRTVEERGPELMISIRRMDIQSSPTASP